jgi:hypothetical protein
MVVQKKGTKAEAGMRSKSGKTAAFSSWEGTQ